MIKIYYKIIQGKYYTKNYSLNTKQRSKRETGKQKDVYKIQEKEDRNKPNHMNNNTYCS